MPVRATAGLLLILALAGCKEVRGFPEMTLEAFPQAFADTAKERRLPDDYRLERQYCDEGYPTRCVYTMRSARLILYGINASSVLKEASVECETECAALDGIGTAILAVRTLAPGLTDADYAGWSRDAKENMAAQRPLRVFIGPILMWMYPPGSSSRSTALVFDISAKADK